MIETTYSNSRVTSKFTSKVFLYMFVALLITAVTSTIVGLLFTKFFPITYSGSVTQQANYKAYTTLLIVSLVAYIPLIIWIQISVLKERSNPTVPFVLYAIVMGVLISSFTMFIPFYLIAISFGITCLVFLAMFCIGYYSKRDLSLLAMIASGLMIGLAMMTLFNLIWMLIFPATFQAFYWIVSMGLLVVVILITIFDFNTVRRLADSGETSKKLAMICAFSLYVDFIYIFIRVLLIVARVASRN